MEIWEEPVRGGYPEPWWASFSGAERIDRYLEVVPRPPMSYLLGIEPLAWSYGSSEGALPASPWLLSPQGRIPLGVLAIVADLSFGAALAGLLDAGVGFTTAELSLTRVREPAVGGDLVATSSLVHRSAQMGLTDARVVDRTGQLVAAGMSRLAVLPPRAELPAIPEHIDPIVEPEYDTPHPWQRDPGGEVLDSSVWSSRSGLEVLRAQAAGELPRPPIGRLTGLAVTAADEGTATVAMPATEWLASPARTVQGGFAAMIADAAIACAIQTHVHRGDSFEPVDIKVNYLRPVIPDGRPLTAVGRVVHLGRSLAIANATVTNAHGKAVAIATGSAVMGGTLG